MSEHILVDWWFPPRDLPQLRWKTIIVEVDVDKATPAERYRVWARATHDKRTTQAVGKGPTFEDALEAALELLELAYQNSQSADDGQLPF